jgi:hypothetical protein
LYGSTKDGQTHFVQTMPVLLLSHRHWLLAPIGAEYIICSASKPYCRVLKRVSFQFLLKWIINVNETTTKRMLFEVQASSKCFNTEQLHLHLNEPSSFALVEFYNWLMNENPNWNGILFNNNQLLTLKYIHTKYVCPKMHILVHYFNPCSGWAEFDFTIS